MKLGILAASTLLGVVSLGPASFAQGDVMQERSRMSAGADSATVGRTAPATATVRPLESARMPAGMLPEQPSGPSRNSVGDMSSEPMAGSSLQRSLRRD